MESITDMPHRSIYDTRDAGFNMRGVAGLWPSHPVNRGRIYFSYVVLNLAAVYPLYVPIFVEG